MTSRRGVIGSLGAAALALVLPKAAASGSRSSGLVEIAPDGLPYRASCRAESPYYWFDNNLFVTVDGKYPKGLYEFDRREGWVLLDDEEAEPLPRIYGDVRAWLRLPGDPVPPPLVPAREFLPLLTRVVT